MNVATEITLAGDHASRGTADAVDLPLMSVIIPVRNDASRLARCLDSLAEQDYPADRFEIIVVDNGSTDDSAAVAAARGATVLRHPGLRVGALRNRGGQIARGDVLVFVDSDHEVSRDWLRVAARELTADDDVLMVGSPCVAPPAGTWVQRYWELHRTRGARRRRVEWLGAGNMFLRRYDFLQIHGFDENLVAAEDVDLCVRLSKLPGCIISDMRIANIHHGEPPTLFDFFWKEYWRGSSGLLGFISHGMPLHELPSLLFPLYYLLGTVVFLAMAVAAFALGSAAWLGVAAALCGLLLPSVLLGLKTSWQLQRLSAVPGLTTLYFTYGLARALALFKR